MLKEQFVVPEQKVINSVNENSHVGKQRQIICFVLDQIISKSK